MAMDRIVMFRGDGHSSDMGGKVYSNHVCQSMISIWEPRFPIANCLAMRDHSSTIGTHCTIHNAKLYGSWFIMAQASLKYAAHVPSKYHFLNQSDHLMMTKFFFPAVITEGLAVS